MGRSIERLVRLLWWVAGGGRSMERPAMVSTARSSTTSWRRSSPLSPSWLWAARWSRGLCRRMRFGRTLCRRGRGPAGDLPGRHVDLEEEGASAAWRLRVSMWAGRWSGARCCCGRATGGGCAGLPSDGRAMLLWWARAGGARVGQLMERLACELVAGRLRYGVAITRRGVAAGQTRGTCAGPPSDGRDAVVVGAGWGCACGAVDGAACVCSCGGSARMRGCR